MEIQPCGNGVVVLPLGRDPQSVMIARCIEFQRSLGHWDERTSDHPAHQFSNPRRALHHLDMARQECAEAWDMLEGGWKNHKRNPKPVDIPELMMELVDVCVFVFNAYAYMGGQSEAELVAVAAARSNQRVAVKTLGMSMAWDIGARSWERNGPSLRQLYGYADQSFGEDWVKEAATRVNYLITKISEVSESMREGLKQIPQTVEDGSFPAASGFIYTEIIPWLYGVVQVVPDADQQKFYSAFMHKMQTNFDRQKGGY